MEKLRAGRAVTVAAVGDSILEGNTSTTPGTDDAVSLVCSTLGSRFGGVTVTKRNRAVSGRTTATSMRNGDFATALADNADLYIIGFGKNDIKSDPPDTLPSYGYPLTASMGGLEHMFRRIRATIPSADIILMGENPYSSGSSLNTRLQAWSSAGRALAAAYGATFVDGYTPFTNLGDWESYLSDGTHPNSAGHALLATAILATMPAGSAPVYVSSPDLPAVSLYGSHRYDRRGWTQVTSSTRASNTNGFTLSGTWSGTDPGPWTSSTAASKVQVNFVGTECLLRLDAGAGNGVVKIQVDGPDTYSSVDLSTIASGQRFLPITGLQMGVHNIIITVVSGTVTWRGLDYLAAPAMVIPATSTRVVYSGAGWSQANDSTLFSGTYKKSTTVGDTIAIDFLGTGVGFEMLRYASGQTLTPTLDGVAQSAMTVSHGSTTNLYGAFIWASGLPYGRHSLSVPVASSTRQILVGSVFSFDESRLARPRLQSGLCKVGDGTVTYPVPLTGQPHVTLSAADSVNAVPPYPTAISATGFTVNGTSAALVAWDAEGSDLIAF